MARLRLDNLSKQFPGKTRVFALREVSFELGSGKCIAILGPSGAGKSTLLRLIAGLEKPTSGDILIDNVSVAATEARDRGVSMAFQYPALLPQLSVLENLRLGPKLRKERDAEERIARIAHSLTLEPLLYRKPETLSGGEQQRVALGRALVVNPRVLLLDEPLANLDPISRLQLRQSIRKVQRELAVTTVYVTHDQAEATEVADTIMILRDGRVQQVGSSRELYRNPANIFVAQFFGPDPPNILEEGSTVIAVRPSQVRVQKDPAGKWTVEEIRDSGWQFVLSLRSEGREIIAYDGGDNGVHPGDAVSFHVDPDRVLRFDRATGERLRITGDDASEKTAAGQKPIF